MCDDLLDQVGLDTNNANVQTFLSNLQANILKAHGRDHAWHIFLQFVPEQASRVKNWISTKLSSGKDRLLTSAYQQVKDAEKRAEERKQGLVEFSDGGIVGCFFLSPSGYEYLGHSSVFTGHYNFFESMKLRGPQYLKDPVTSKWESAFQQDIHAMLLIADNKKKNLKKTLKKLLFDTHEFARIVTVEKGFLLRNASGRPIEHFGYEDGISQPLFLLGDKKEVINEYCKPKIVLAKDPLVKLPYCYGSFLVFRKIEQNVKKFNKKRKLVADKLCTKEMEHDRISLAGAFVIGRFENGTPVTEYSTEQSGTFNVNNFDFSKDTGNKCPFHAHIRMTNPRADMIEPKDLRRIVRRGIPYDEKGRNRHLTDSPSWGVGLLFMCYQADLADQFEVIQDWANRGIIGWKIRGRDGIIGQNGNAQFQKWHCKWDASTEPIEENLFDSVTTLKGGEYFFAPSIPFLQNL
jgi:Dyp-type peroxidase family